VPWLGSPTAVGEHVLLNRVRGMRCLEWATGATAWDEPKLGRCMYTVPDGKLYVRDQKGAVLLAAADPTGYRALARFTPPRSDAGQPSWTFPVVANGHLYVRDYDTLSRYDVRDPGRPAQEVADAVFVP